MKPRHISALSQEHLIKLACYDRLTNLPNRIFFNEILNKTLSHSKRHNRIIAVLLINLDNFKSINDLHGHATGDSILKEIAFRLSLVVRADDILARLGGDEFMLVLNEINQAKFASAAAEKILNTCRHPIHFNSQEFIMNASIGISIFPNNGMSLEDLENHADIAMQKAKKGGGNKFEYFTPALNIEAYQFIKLEKALFKAIEKNEFVLYYQPKLNLLDGKINGVEALIRWIHPELGIINPTNFIPLAEETGLIMHLGEWALREACKTNKAWQSQGLQPISMAVNLSAKQFRHNNIAELVEKVLTETGLEPKYLNLEITETAVMDNIELAILRLRDIKAMGVEISIDDFGTGYSSISQLKHFPINTLKIDQTFIKGIPTDSNDMAITSAIIVLAHRLGMNVVGEGVETKEQMQFLVDNDCDIIQGFFISRPLPENKMVLQFHDNDIINDA